MDHLPEDERLEALQAIGPLDTPDEDRFDRITSLVGRLLHVPVSLITLVDGDRQWTKSRFGTDERESPLSRSICRHVVADDAPVVVADLRLDPRFADHPVLDTGARFYAGWPLRDGSGVPLGTLCVLDDEPRVLTPGEAGLMQSLAGWAQAELNADALTSALTQVGLAEQRLLSLLDSAPAAVLRVAGDGRVQWANTPARTLFGLPDPVGAQLSLLLPTVSLAHLGAHGRRADDARSSAGRRSTEAGRRADGSSFAAELTVSVEEGTDPPRHVVFVRALDEDGARGAELAQLRQRTDVVFDALAEGVVGVDGDGTVSFGNLAAAQMLQQRRSDLPGVRWHDVLHAGACPGALCAHTDPLALAGRTLLGVIHRADASTLPVELTVRMLGADDGSAGVVMTLHDLTERLRVERLTSDLVSAVSHELRTPLTSIRGSLGLLVAGVVDPASAQGARMLEIATESSERLSRLVNDILDLERLQAGKVELVIGRHRATSLLRSAIQAVSGAALAAGVTVDVVDSEVRVLGDADRAVQVLVNLLGNAVKFSAPGTRVTASVSQEGDRVLLSVADQGRGIPPDQLERVFDRFAQVDAGDSRGFEGSGLGLAIARGLAEQHGGSLSATSTVGVGSTFVLTLPLAPQQRRLVAYAPANQVPDELRAVLTRRGWEAIAVPSDGLATAGAGALMLAPGGEQVVAAVRREAAALRLPLMVLTTADVGAPGVAVAAVAPDPSSFRYRVLLAEDDDDLALVLSSALVSRGVEVSRASTQEQAVTAMCAVRPDLVVLDVRLAGGDGFGVVDHLWSEPHLPPVVVYSVLELEDAERTRLQAGSTSSLTQGRDRVEDVVRDVLTALRQVQSPDGLPISPS